MGTTGKRNRMPACRRLASRSRAGTGGRGTNSGAGNARVSRCQWRGRGAFGKETAGSLSDTARLPCLCLRAAVGEANVAEKMRETGALIGGEGNGGVIDPRVGFVRDPFIGMGLILNLMAETGKKLSELVAGLPAYCIVKDKFTVGRDRLPNLFANLRKRWPEAAVNDLDGLRLDWKDRWVHVRPSNTEPIVRVIAEAASENEAQGLCREVGGLL